MADMQKNEIRDIGEEGREGFRSRFQHKLSGVRSNLSERFREQDQRTMMFVGLGLLSVGVGFGIWALVRRFRNREEIPAYYSEEYPRHTPGY